MVVDDDKCVAHIMEMVLRKHLEPLETFLFWSVSAAKEAIAAIRAGYKPDFMILDIQINSVNGLDVYYEAQKYFDGVPSIFLTGMEESDSEYQRVIEEIKDPQRIVRKDRVRFFEDILPQIPQREIYGRCQNCSMASDKTSCRMRSEDI